jgi:hypothetical protein
MGSVLQLCGLVATRRGKASPIINAWTDLIIEKRIDVEISTFPIFNKRCYFICIGSWNKLRHPPKLPLICWREKIFLPKLRISGLMRAFAEWVGHLNITSVSASFDSESVSDSCSLMDEESESEGKESESQINGSEKPMADCGSDMFAQQNLPDPAKFPMLHSLGVCTTAHMDRLLQEIVQLHGGRSISFTC